MRFEPIFKYSVEKMKLIVETNWTGAAVCWSENSLRSLYGAVTRGSLMPTAKEGRLELFEVWSELNFVE
jgi:hypothetical protein